MTFATKVVMQMTENIGEYILIEKHEFEYDGVVDLCDRSAVGAAKNARDVAQSTAATAGGEADTEHGKLSPFYTNEMNAEHLFTPGQEGELLTASMAPLGSELGDTQHAAELAGARTRNASGFTKTLQQAQRDKDKAVAGASQGVAAQDILGAKQLNQEGAAGEMGLFGADTNKQLASMGLENQAINTQIEAGKSGWLQNMNDTIKAISGAMPGTKAGGCWIAAATYGGWEHPRVDVVRQFIFNDWAKRSIVGALVASLYMKFGERVAEVVKISPLLKRVFRKLFDTI